MKNSHIQVDLKLPALQSLLYFYLHAISISQIPTGSVIELVRDGMVGALGGCEAQTGRGGGALIFVVF